MRSLVFGTQALRGDAGIAQIRLAYALGCRVFDTALAYGNQALLAEALGRHREVRIVSKVTRLHVEELSTRSAVERVLAELRLEVIDTRLIHAPKGVAHETIYGELLALQLEGKVRRCGLSNYTLKHLERLAAVGMVPDTLQVEAHPYLPERDLLAYCQERNIEVLAHSAFAGGQVFRDGDLRALANAEGSSVAQLVLAWSRAHGALPVVSSTHPAHLRELLEPRSVVMTPSIMKAMAKLERGLRLCNDPTWAEFI